MTWICLTLTLLVGYPHDVRVCSDTAGVRADLDGVTCSLYRYEDDSAILVCEDATDRCTDSMRHDARGAGCAVGNVEATAERGER